MRVLVLTGSLSVGGAEKALLNLVEMLGRTAPDGQESLEVHFCAFGKRGAFDKAMLERARALPVPVRVIGSRRFYDPASWREIRDYVREHDIELIHSFLLAADIVANAIGRLEGVPVVTSLRNVPESYLRARGDFALLMRLLVLRRASRLVALSDSIRRSWIERFGIGEERIVTIPNAAAIGKFLAIPAERPVDGNRPLTVTTVGRLMPQKAHDDFLRAAALVLRACPDTRFLIVGQGELEESLKALAASLDIADAIEFAGLRDDVEQVLARSHVFVLSSLWEGMSVAAIEAMAAALPAVLTAVGANPDLIDEGVHGRLVPPARPEHLAEAILALLRDPERRLAMGLRAREKAATAYAADANCQAYLRLYREVLGRAAGPQTR